MAKEIDGAERRSWWRYFLPYRSSQLPVRCRRVHAIWAAAPVKRDFQQANSLVREHSVSRVGQLACGILRRVETVRLVSRQIG